MSFSGVIYVLLMKQYRKPGQYRQLLIFQTVLGRKMAKNRRFSDTIVSNLHYLSLYSFFVGFFIPILLLFHGKLSHSVLKNHSFNYQIQLQPNFFLGLIWGLSGTKRVKILHFWPKNWDKIVIPSQNVDSASVKVDFSRNYHW